MAEIFREALATPLRLQAVLKLLVLLGDKPRKEVLALLQPESLSEDQNTVNAIITLLITLGIVRKIAPDDQLGLAEHVPSDIDRLESYRLYMQKRLLGVTNPNAPNNYVLNQFAAWIAVQDERIAQLKKVDLTARFNEEMYPAEANDASDAQTRVMNDTKYNGWINWATFLGWGLSHNAFKAGFVPDASNRIFGVLGALLAEEDPLPMSIFMDRLAEHCPELDGGSLFENAWQLSRPTENRGSRLSLMLSTGLRVLERQGELTLLLMPDAGDLWRLFPIQGGLNQVSHISHRGA